jgi:hypothetical protein
VTVNLPYSIKIGESFELPITVYNYFNDSTTANITLLNSDEDFQIVAGNAKLVEKYRVDMQIFVESNSGATKTIIIHPKKVGAMTFQVTARTRSYIDKIERNLLVEAEILEQRANVLKLVDLRNSSVDSEKIKVEIPPDASSDSIKFQVNVHGKN